MQFEISSSDTLGKRVGNKRYLHVNALPAPADGPDARDLLTWLFCSPALARKIPGRTDSKRDQHATHERNRLGNLICDRLGAAADFLVTDEDMLEVARWVVRNKPFDRLYFYGNDLPIHVSLQPEPHGQVVIMRATAAGRLVPRVGSRGAL